MYSLYGVSHAVWSHRSHHTQLLQCVLVLPFLWKLLLLRCLTLNELLPTLRRAFDVTIQILELIRTRQRLHQTHIHSSFVHRPRNMFVSFIKQPTNVYTNCTLCPNKNNPEIFICNLKKNSAILIIFWNQYFWHNLPSNDFSIFHLIQHLRLHYLENSTSKICVKINKTTSINISDIIDCHLKQNH